MDFVDSQEGIQEGLNKEKKEVLINTFPNPAERTSAGEKKKKKKKKQKSCYHVKQGLELQALCREERVGRGERERVLGTKRTVLLLQLCISDNVLSSKT